MQKLFTKSRSSLDLDIESSSKVVKDYVGTSQSLDLGQV